MKANSKRMILVCCGLLLAMGVEPLSANAGSLNPTVTTTRTTVTVTSPIVDVYAGLVVGQPVNVSQNAVNNIVAVMQVGKGHQTAYIFQTGKNNIVNLTQISFGAGASVLGN
ncbi:MAG: hypothetical protein P4M15_13740 [Alphaproteobacteria bacterium]|nr:hypothetical protein [Alphaproteobacteria bacterium]